MNFITKKLMIQVGIFIASAVVSSIAEKKALELFDKHEDNDPEVIEAEVEEENIEDPQND